MRSLAAKERALRRCPREMQKDLVSLNLEEHGARGNVYEQPGGGRSFPGAPLSRQLVTVLPPSPGSHFRLPKAKLVIMKGVLLGCFLLKGVGLRMTSAQTWPH